MSNKPIRLFHHFIFNGRTKPFTPRLGNEKIFNDDVNLHLNLSRYVVESDHGEAGKVVAPSLVWEIKILQEQSISSLRDSEGKRDVNNQWGKIMLKIFPN